MGTVNPGIVDLFPVQIVKNRMENHEELNKELLSLIGRIREADPGMQASLRNGWRSIQDFSKLDHPALNRLFATIRERVTEISLLYGEKLRNHRPEDWKFHSWCNVATKGSFNIKHDHARYGNKNAYVWVGVYYVSMGDQDGDEPLGGRIIFHDGYLGPDREEVSPARPQRTFVYQPEAGDIIIFPSWLQHSVEEFRGKGERVILGFNASHDEINIEIGFRDRKFPLLWRHFPRAMKVVRRLSPVDIYYR